MSRRPHFLEPLLAKDHGPLVLVNGRTGAIVATHVVLAADSRTRRRGLLGRDGMADGETLVLAPCNAVHTFFMRFAIDVIFVARDGRTLKVCRRVGPWRIALAFRAFATLELAPGAIERTQTVAGDRLALETLLTTDNSIR